MTLPLSIAKRLFHYRLSRARRAVENGFGILDSRFRIFHTKISLQPANATKIVLCCCVLHNMLRTLTNNSYNAIGYGGVAGDNGNINEGSWRSELESPYVQPIPSRQTRHNSHDAEEVRSHFIKIASGQVVKFCGNGIKYKYIFKGLYNDSLINFVTKST